MPKDICAKLTGAGLARDCQGGDTEGPLGWGCVCDATGIAGYHVTVNAYNVKEYPGFAADVERANKQAAADDYPDLQILHPSTRTIVSWGAKPGASTKDSLDTAEGNKWETCIKARRGAAACAKLQPAYYAANKALHEAAKRAVVGK